jgi:hypothetical protein
LRGLTDRRGSRFAILVVVFKINAMQEGRGKTRSGPNSFSLAPPAPSSLPFLFPSTARWKKRIKKNQKRVLMNLSLIDWDDF